MKFDASKEANKLIGMAENVFRHDDHGRNSHTCALTKEWLNLSGAEKNQTFAALENKLPSSRIDEMLHKVEKPAGSIQVVPSVVFGRENESHDIVDVAFRGAKGDEVNVASWHDNREVGKHYTGARVSADYHIMSRCELP